MLRCPFNNFSKCDGSCPFSMQDFTSCRLATALIAIEGICRGQVAQATTTNAHLVEVKERLDALQGTAKDPKPARRVLCKHVDQPRVMLSSANNTRLIIPNEEGALMWARLGERVSYSITAHGEVLVFAGGDRKLSQHGDGGDTRSLSMQSDTPRLAALFPDARVVYMKMAEQGGIFRFTPTGERE